MEGKVEGGKKMNGRIKGRTYQRYGSEFISQGGKTVENKELGWRVVFYCLVLKVWKPTLASQFPALYPPGHFTNYHTEF